MITIRSASSAMEREPLRSPFGFKGGYLTELWQSLVRLESDQGEEGIGLGVQSVLWSDREVFIRSGELGGNRLMQQVTRTMIAAARGLAFETPLDLLDQLLPLAQAYADEMNGQRVSRTFVLNSLVPVDQAAWMLSAIRAGSSDLAALVPNPVRDALGYRHTALANIPVVAYGMSAEDIRKLLDDGYFLLKLKIGSDPEQDGDPEKMLAWDCKRLQLVHELAISYKTPYTESGHIAYYIDANGRYDTKDRLLRLLDYADQIGALERILLLEEPFPEEQKMDVSDVPVRLAADESVHSVLDAIERMDLGYGAMALKPIAKTMSLSLQVAMAAKTRGVPCFGADLTVNPMMVDWNKSLAARLAPLPGLKVGALESNGPQNYANWELMQTYHPAHGKSWTRTELGLFPVTDEFFAVSGGVFAASRHYLAVLQSDSDGQGV
ncbi:enolase C-terminal domain-like protein [Paenibacillus cremeus]|uniref:L-alanine-DL-glutamate epimerase n=1 Tax=Paenibacillus cremeus TaxID=2163881 RepID=A0A559K515_9BACL|nr:enolase C-terminal domain-like protein [Paenibacillus cremeus]TVY07235.1 L-alanine-DL-glutamate epimerase [Paenibacillus cremeus]